MLYEVITRIGEQVMADIRFHDPSYLDDAEVTEYLNLLGGRLVAVAPNVRQAFEFFVIRDPQINAFALPGGFIGVNTGLITSSASESELASVLAHEIAHVVQRHIARMVGTQQQMQLPMIAARITSYNVCYTKLLRIRCRSTAAPRPATRCGPGCPS